MKFGSKTDQVDLSPCYSREEMHISPFGPTQDTKWTWHIVVLVWHALISIVYSKTAIGTLEPVCIHKKQCAKKQCVRLDEEIKTYNNNISYYGSVNSFKLSKIKTANLEIILQRSHVISSINLDIDGFRQ